MAGHRMQVGRYEGKTIAIDARTESVVASADTPEALMLILREHGHQHSLIVTIPTDDDPVFVG